MFCPSYRMQRMVCRWLVVNPCRAFLAFNVHGVYNLTKQCGRAVARTCWIFPHRVRKLTRRLNPPARFAVATARCPNEEGQHPMSVDQGIIAPPTLAKKSAVEAVKENSQALRGTIALELLQDSDHFDDQNKQLLKFHGTYQQDDRDARKGRSKSGVGKYYMFMVRCKIPGGKATAEQYLALDDLADRCGNGTLRITSRQGIQFHGVVKSH